MYKMPAVFHCSTAGWKVHGSYEIRNVCSVLHRLAFPPLQMWYSERRETWVCFFPLVVTTQFNGRYGGGPPRFGGNRGGGGGKFGNPGDRLRKKQWNLDELPKFEKNFYQQHPDVARRSMVWWRQCCVTVLKMCFPRHRCTCWELRNRQQPLVLTCSHVSILAARGRTIQKGQSHHSQRQRMSKPHHQVSRSRLPL